MKLDQEKKIQIRLEELDQEKSGEFGWHNSKCHFWKSSLNSDWSRLYSLRCNVLKRSLNPSFLPPAVGKTVGKTSFSRRTKTLNSKSRDRVPKAVLYCLHPQSGNSWNVTVVLALDPLLDMQQWHGKKTCWMGTCQSSIMPHPGLCLDRDAEPLPCVPHTHTYKQEAYS